MYIVNVIETNKRIYLFTFVIHSKRNVDIKLLRNMSVNEYETLFNITHIKVKEQTFNCPSFYLSHS